MKARAKAQPYLPRHSRWQAHHWRWAVWLFFIALALPAFALIAHARSQLKWESLHRFQQYSVELTQRLDQQIQRWLTREEQRPSADYFFVAHNYSGAGYQVRSPLSYLPLSSPWPGALGYFQVDAEGLMSTPLIPGDFNDDLDQASLWGLDPAELAQRQALASQIYQILARNALAQAAPAPQASVQGDQVASAKARTAAADHDEKEIVSPQPTEVAAVSTPTLSRAVNESNDSVARPSSAGLEAPNAAELEAPSRAAAAPMTLSPARSNTTQNGFQRLQEELAQRQEHNLRNPSESLTTAELRTQAQQYTKPAAAERERSSASSAGAQAVASTELGLNHALSEEKKLAGLAKAESPAPLEPRMLADQAIDDIASVGDSIGRSAGFPTSIPRAELDLTGFQQGLGHFQFSPLDSGHFVLFRQVFIDDQSYFQGLLIDTQAWVSALIAEEFYRGPWAKRARLSLHHQGLALAQLAPHQDSYLSNTTAMPVAGLIHYEQNLAAPFNLLGLDFQLMQLPPSPGTAVLWWSAGALLLALSLGCWLMYRAGLRQIELARQQENFVAAISHELKTPLTSIRMYGEMLGAGWVPEEKRGQYYQFIQDEGERLSRLIDQVLQLARLKRTSEGIKRQLLSPAQVETLFKSKVLPYIQRQGCHWYWYCPVELNQRPLQLDPDAITQILLNLAENAVKFSAHTGYCELNLYWQQDSNDTLCLHISDNGPGLNPAQLQQIFQAFYRGEEELQRQTQGTGLGLALVQQLCLAQGIQIEARNRSATTPAMQQTEEISSGAEFILRFH